MKAVTLASESGAFNVLYFEFDGAGGDGRNAYVEVCSHKIIIITVSSSHFSFFSFFYF